MTPEPNHSETVLYNPFPGNKIPSSKFGSNFNFTKTSLFLTQFFFIKLSRTYRRQYG